MIVVTGGTGLVGAHLLLQLAQSNERIRAIKRNQSDLRVFNRVFKDHATLATHIEWVEGDITDLFSLEPYLADATQVYHCAAMISFYPHEAKKMLHVNIEGTANVVNTCLEYNVGKLCYASSVAALGRVTATGVIDEETQWEASAENSNYSISKYGAEREVWRGIAEGMNAVIVNPSIIIGAGEWSKGSSNMFREVWKGLRFYTQGRTGFVDVHDVSNIMIKLMNSAVSGQRFILNAENISFHDFFNRVAVLLNKKPPAVYANPFLTSLAWRTEAVKELLLNTKPLITRETAISAHKKYEYANDKIRRELNYDFISLQQSLKDVCMQFIKDQSAA